MFPLFSFYRSYLKLGLIFDLHVLVLRYDSGGQNVPAASKDTHLNCGCPSKREERLLAFFPFFIFEEKRGFVEELLQISDFLEISREKRTDFTPLYFAELLARAAVA